jgi:hypothetical protein
MLPIFALVALLAWHVAILGYAMVLQSAAAGAAASEYAITASVREAEDAAEDRLAFYDDDDISVSRAASGELRVSVRVPDVAGAFVPGMPTTISSTRSVVMEP